MQSSRSVPSARRRGSARGLLVAAALLGVTVSTVPAASAAPVLPDVGSVRHLHVDLDVKGSVPLGTQLSGAGFTFTSATVSGTCVTDVLSGCDVDWTSGAVSGNGTSDLRLPTGTYTVTQDAGRALPGLQPRVGPVATVTIGDHWATFGRIKLWQKTGALTVSNASLYRHTVTARVIDQATGAAVKGAQYRLSGPGLPLAGIDSSNSKGQLSFSTLFGLPLYRPGSWTLTPVDLDPKYDATPVTVEITSAGANALDLGTVALTPPPVHTGTGTLTLQTTGPVPAGLDLSGAEFALTSTTDDEVTSTCVTDALGSCGVEVLAAGSQPSGAGQVALPAGVYAIEQLTTTAGLAIDEDIDDLVLCISPVPGTCAATVTAVNESLFRQTAQVVVRQGGAALADLELTLAGPGFPVLPTALAAEGDDALPPAALDPGYRSEPVITDADGVAAWEGWFVPGTWTVTVAGEEEPLVVTTLETTITEATEGSRWDVAIELPALGNPDDGGTGGEGGPGGTGTGGTGTGGTGTEGTGTGTGTGTTGGTGGGGAATTGGTSTTATAAARPAPAAGARATNQPPEIPAPSAAASSTPARPAGPAQGAGTVGGEQVFVAGEEPALETAASNQLRTGGLVLGIGVLFVAVVLGGVMYLRRRARGIA